MTIYDSPVIYYGNEKGMWGADAPDSRKPMIWEDIKFEKETDTLKKYSKNRGKIAAIFKTDLVKDDISYEVKSKPSLEKFYADLKEFRNFDKNLLRRGSIEVLDLDHEVFLEDGTSKEIIENDVLAYERKYKGRSSIIILNRSASGKDIEVPVEGKKGYTEFFTGTRYKVTGKKLKLSVPGYGYLVLYRRVKID
jgi:glycosidase